jgi:hypothetical protein
LYGGWLLGAFGFRTPLGAFGFAAFFGDALLRGVADAAAGEATAGAAVVIFLCRILNEFLEKL